MALSSYLLKFLGTVCGLVLALSLAGCDYWPPALQAQTNQSRCETQPHRRENAKFKPQVPAFSKSRKNLGGRVDDLAGINGEKTAMITGLQSQLDAVRARALKTISPKAPAKM